MREIKRIDIITEKLNTLWKQFPDFRFWQLIQMLDIPEEKQNTDPFFWEEDVWAKIIDDTIDKYSK